MDQTYEGNGCCISAGQGSRIITRMGQEIAHSCKEHVAVTCEKPNKQSCGGGWKSYGLSCCVFIPDRIQQKDAWMYCQQLNADLVRIHDDDENNFLKRHVYYEYWIGLSDPHSDGVWVWMDGTSPKNYTK